VFNIKPDGCYRSRLVAKGFSQVEGINFDELFSPVVRYKTARLLLAVVALEDLDIQSVDIKTAYLYGDLDKEIYMEQPEGFKLPGKENKVWQLRKALYSLKQAGLSWWHTITKSMLALEFKRCKSDAGVYYYHDKKTVRLANSKARIKPTAPLSAFNKKNSIEFSLDFLHYLYNYYMVCALFSHTYHVTHHVTSCDVML